MNIVIYFVILAVLAGTSLAANLTVTSAIDDYVANANRQNRNDIKSSKMQIDCVNERGKDAIRIIKDQQEETLLEIQRFEDSLIPLESLSLIRKHCVQKYKTLLVTVSSTKSSFQSCIIAAQTRLDSLTTQSTSYIKNAESIVDVSLPKAVENCNKTFYNNPPKLEDCVVNNVTSYTNSIQSNLRSVDKSLDASSCTSVDLSRDAIKCSFKSENKVLVTIGKVTSLIDNCVTETETVCPCAKNLAVESETPSARRLLMDYGLQNGNRQNFNMN